MLPDDFTEMDTDLEERLSSWRRVSGVVEQRHDSGGETGVNEREVRARQRRTGNMCLTTVKTHEAFYADLEAFVRQEGRSPQHQQRVEDWLPLPWACSSKAARFCWKKASSKSMITCPGKSFRQSMSSRHPRHQSHGFSDSWVADRGNRYGLFSRARVVS
jgi:hypothetical protein